jgi:hypothetical protein
VFTYILLTAPVGPLACCGNPEAEDNLPDSRCFSLKNCFAVSLTYESMGYRDLRNHGRWMRYAP